MGSRLWSPLGLALLCGHCALGAVLTTASAVGLVGAPILFGVNVNYVWPPVAILGGFGLWLWSGRARPDEACAKP